MRDGETSSPPMEYRHGSHSIYDLKYHVIFCKKYHMTRGFLAITVDSVNEEKIQKCIGNKGQHHKDDDIKITDIGALAQ